VAGLVKDMMTDLIDGLLTMFKDRKIIMWSDGISSYQIPIEQPDRTVLAVWTNGQEGVADQCKRGVKILQGLAANYYLDCGGENMFVPGPTWCEYNFWKNIYG